MCSHFLYISTSLILHYSYKILHIYVKCDVQLYVVEHHKVKVHIFSYFSSHFPSAHWKSWAETRCFILRLGNFFTDFWKGCSHFEVDANKKLKNSWSKAYPRVASPLLHTTLQTSTIIVQSLGNRTVGVAKVDPVMCG